MDIGVTILGMAGFVFTIGMLIAALGLFVALHVLVCGGVHARRPGTKGAAPCLTRVIVVAALIPPALGLWCQATGANEQPGASWANLNAHIRPLYEEGRFDEALDMAKRAVRMAEESFGPDDPRVAESLNGLANCHLALCQMDEAKRLYERVLAIRRQAFGPRHPEVAKALANLAYLAHFDRDYPNAKRLYRQAVDAFEQSVGWYDPHLAPVLESYAVLWSDLGEREKATAAMQRAWMIRQLPQQEEVVTWSGFDRARCQGKAPPDNASGP